MAMSHSECGMRQVHLYSDMSFNKQTCLYQGCVNVKQDGRFAEFDNSILTSTRTKDGDHCQLLCDNVAQLWSSVKLLHSSRL